MPNNIKLLKWSELFSRSLPTDKSVAILTDGPVTAQDRTDVIDALNLDQTSIKPGFKDVSANYTATFADTYILACGGSAITITLPKASAEADKIGGVLYIKSDCGQDVTIEPVSGDTIYDAANIVLSAGDAVQLVCVDSSTWAVFSAYQWVYSPP
jgi:hypothetical protein